MNAVSDMYFMPRIICNRFFVIFSNSYDIYDKMYLYVYNINKKSIQYFRDIEQPLTGQY